MHSKFCDEWEIKKEGGAHRMDAYGNTVQHAIGIVKSLVTSFYNFLKFCLALEVCI